MAIARAPNEVLSRAGPRGSSVEARELTRTERLARQWWLVFLAIPFGWMTWAAFVYTGIRVGHRRWIAIGAVYFAITAALITLIAIDDEDGAQLLIGAGTVGSLLLWVTSAAHSLSLRREFMHRARLRELGAGPTIERQVASELAASDPQLARTLGVGRPDRAGSEHGGVVDVNGVPAGVLSRLPGLDDALAHQAVELRPFASVEELGSVLDLSPHTVEDLRDRTIFVRRS